MFLFGKELEGYVDGIIHEETQLANTGIDLTVDSVRKPTSPTDLDFGGSEEKLGDLDPVEPAKRSPEDDYGWWNLEGGIYIIEFNEEINVSEGLGLVVPLNRMTSGGSFHPPLIFQGDLRESPVLHVSSSGLNIKENARISRLMVWT
ncbi:MAG: dCTP deaminase [Candidatus Bipolaricaulota bacterium]|nr:dCTP deaminase [Candidatus Bipolaricaulota bacterium]MBS3791197.1 dCTP deaminase [Candidatus Bipolaricaulota bacterium]